MTFPKKPVRPYQCSTRGLEEYQANLHQQQLQQEQQRLYELQQQQLGIPPEPEVVYIAKTHSGYMTKLGWKKNLFGQDSWQRR